MLNLDEVNATIDQLEKAELTFDTCQKLAMLYTVRDHNTTRTDVVAPSKTMPSYDIYCNDKRRFQLGQLTDTVILDDLRFVCSDILLLVQRIYNGSDIEAEREQIRDIIHELTTKFL